MRPRTGRLYRFVASGWDRFDRRGYMPEDGALVRVLKAPPGAPPNGTMGHCYIGDAEGRFIGLVCIASLEEVR